MDRKYKSVLIVSIIIFFVLGVIIGRKSNELIEPFEIPQWSVKTFSKDGQIIYESDGETYITEDKREAWNELLEQINIVCKPRVFNEGTTAHTKYKIEMKNGDIYYIEWLGCMEQVEITYPNGKVKKYYGYHR